MCLHDTGSSSIRNKNKMWCLVSMKMFPNELVLERNFTKQRACKMTAENQRKTKPNRINFDLRLNDIAIESRTGLKVSIWNEN